MDRKQIYIGSLFLIALLSGCNKQLPEKPNILLITSDYQAWEDTPQLTPVLQMPSLDRLSKEGVVFNNHYCTAPVCMPSRYTIITGTYPHTHGAWDNTGNWIPPESPVLMEYLKEAGYSTTGIGKMHFKPWDRMAGFDRRVIADAQGNWAGDTLKKDDYYYYLKSAGMTRFDYLKYQDSTDLYGVYPWPYNDTLDIDYFVGQKTVDLVKSGELAGDPWFLWVSFNGPHNPWDPPSELMDYYFNRELPAARYREGELSSKPYAHTITRYNYTRRVVDTIDMNPDKRREYIRRIRAGHFGGLELIDNQIGRILDELEKSGGLDNTIVIFTADHGAHLGDHDLIHKGTHYERSAHVPFIVWSPAYLRHREVNWYTSHVDLFPTIMELAGGKITGSLEGKSFTEQLKGAGRGNDRAVIEILGGTSVVTDKYKLGLYRQYREGDFYDRQADPGEFNNLIDDPAYTSIVEELTAYLYSIDPTLDTGHRTAPEITVEPGSVFLEAGERKSGDEIFTPAGRHISVSFDLDMPGDFEIFSWRSASHGFSISLSDAELKLIIREWGKNSYYSMPVRQLEKSKLKLDLDINGRVNLYVNAKLEGELQTSWPPPLQPGRREYVSGTMAAGINLLEAGGRNTREEILSDLSFKGVVLVEMHN